MQIGKKCFGGQGSVRSDLWSLSTVREEIVKSACSVSGQVEVRFSSTFDLLKVTCGILQ